MFSWKVMPHILADRRMHKMKSMPHIIDCVRNHCGLAALNNFSPFGIKKEYLCAPNGCIGSCWLVGAIALKFSSAAFIFIKKILSFQASFPIAAIVISFLSINYKLFSKGDTASELIDLHIDQITPNDAEILIWLDESLKDRNYFQQSLHKVIENENLKTKYLSYPRNLIETGEWMSDQPSLNLL